jgi:hypothetical protein
MISVWWEDVWCLLYDNGLPFLGCYVGVGNDINSVDSFKKVTYVIVLLK